MPGLQANLLAEERVICAIDTSEEQRAEFLVSLAKGAGAWVVKEGLELQSATSWKYCSELAAENDLDWVADAKVYDIPRTTAGIVNNLAELDHPPVAVTMGTRAGIDSMKEAQRIAKEAGIMVMGVTLLTSIGKEETKRFERILPKTAVRREVRRATDAGIGGLVCSGLEVKMAKDPVKGNSSLFAMIPGTRSKGADTQDQKRSITPQQAIEGGADILVIGSQVTGAEDPAAAYAAVVQEIRQGLQRRAA